MCVCVCVCVCVGERETMNERLSFTHSSEKLSHDLGRQPEYPIIYEYFIQCFKSATNDIKQCVSTCAFAMRVSVYSFLLIFLIIIGIF